MAQEEFDETLDPRPKNPLSAYNLYFQCERRRILDGTDHLELRVTPEDVRNIVIAHANRGKRAHRKSHGKISFRDLARTIASRWKKIDAANKAVFDAQAMIEKEKYSRAYKAWKARKKARAKAAGREEPKKQKRTPKKQANGLEMGPTPIAAVTAATQSPIMQQAAAPGLQPIPMLHQQQRQQIMNQNIGQQQQPMMNMGGNAVNNMGMNMNGMMMNNEAAAKLEALKAMLGQINTEISSQMNAISMTSPGPAPASQNEFQHNMMQQNQMQNQMGWNIPTSNFAGGSTQNQHPGQNIQFGNQMNLPNFANQDSMTNPTSMIQNTGNMMNHQALPNNMGNNNMGNINMGNINMSNSPNLSNEVPSNNNMGFDLPPHLEPNDIALL